jgi:hypothetical protein
MAGPKNCQKTRKNTDTMGAGKCQKIEKIIVLWICLQECYPHEINILKSELLKLKIVPEHALEPYYPDLLLQLRTTAAYLSKS